MASKPYSWDNNSSWGTTATKTVSANGTYTAYVKNGSGDVGSCLYTLSNIDKTPPSCSISGNATSWTKDPIHLTVTISDNSNAFASPSIKWSDNGSSDLVRGITANAKYTVTVTDKAETEDVQEDVESNE